MNTKINTVIEALEQAQKCVYSRSGFLAQEYINDALALLRSLPEQGEGPVAWMSDDGGVISAKVHEGMEHAESPLLVHYSTPPYAHPPQVGPEEEKDGLGDASKTRPALSAVSPQPSASEDAASIAIAEFDACTATPEEVEAYLRNEGLDPDEEREYGRKVIEWLKTHIRKNEKPWHPSCPKRPSEGPCNCG